MERIVGIDFGRKRTGIAVSDPLGIFASALDTLSSGDVLAFLKNYTLKEKIVRIVVGYPVNMNNKPSEAAADLEPFLNMLRKQFPDIPVTLQDERFTSKIAMKALIDGGMKKSDRRIKGNIDKVSAAIILQSYLDSRVRSENDKREAL